MSNLREILQEEALAEVNEILSEADSKADRLIREAKNKASERVEAYREKAEAELRAATRRAESASELTVSVARIRARGEEIAFVREKVLAALEEISTKPTFREILEALAEEAIKAVQGAEALVLHPDDRDKLSVWAKQKGLALQTDPGLHLGVRIVASGGQRSVENSLPQRLQRGWEALVSGVAQRLWGEPQSLSDGEKV
jgi:V/A-type H+-transporting ATPase subunit E